MPSINKIAKSRISRATARITTQSFNVGMFLAEADANLNGQDFWTVSSVDDVLAIPGMATTSPSYLAAAAYFGLAISPDKLIIGQKLASDADHGAAVARIIAAGAKPYFVGAETRVFAEQQTITTYVNTKRMYFVAMSNTAADIVAAGQSGAETANSDRMALCYEVGNTKTYNDMRAIGYFSAAPTGSWVAAAQVFNGAIKADLTDAEYDDAITNRMNVFVDFGGLVAMQNGLASSGEWIDVIVNLDWVDARIEEELALLKLANPKINYADDGVLLERTAILKVLRTAEDMSILANVDLISQSPDDVLDSIKLSRKYEGHNWSADLVQAIQATTVDGKVGV